MGRAQYRCNFLCLGIEATEKVMLRNQTSLPHVIWLRMGVGFWESKESILSDGAVDARHLQEGIEKPR